MSIPPLVYIEFEKNRFFIFKIPILQYTELLIHTKIFDWLMNVLKAIAGELGGKAYKLPSWRNRTKQK